MQASRGLIADGYTRKAVDTSPASPSDASAQDKSPEEEHKGNIRDFPPHDDFKIAG